MELNKKKKKLPLDYLNLMLSPRNVTVTKVPKDAKKKKSKNLKYLFFKRVQLDFDRFSTDIPLTNLQWVEEAQWCNW